jgi:hypothetical protein
MVETGWNIATSWRSCWGELWTDANTSTTSTESSTTTVLKTLWSLLSATTLDSIIQGQTPSGGLTSNVRAVGDLFVAAVLSSRATRVLSAEGTATASTPTNSPAEDAESFRPAHEPIVMARKPLAGTVAANCLEYGTGALNVDGCRIGTDDNTARHTLHSMRGGNFENHQPSERIESGGNGLGRWPANVVLSHHEDCQDLPDEASLGIWDCHPSCPVRLLDEQSGEASFNPKGAFGTAKRDAGRLYGGGKGLPHAGQDVFGYGDSGGASRFFYTAKSSSAERSAGLGGVQEGADRNSHPT